MDNNKKIVLVAILLMIASTNFSRLTGNENIRPIQYISLLTIGALFAILAQLVFAKFRKE